MQWSPDRNAGFSRANPQKLILPIIIDPEYHYESVNVEAQEQNRRSLLWWMRRIVALRKQTKAFGRGTFELLSADNPRIFAFLRAHENERVLVVANLSRFVQYVELDLHRFAGVAPREMFGGSLFPKIGEQPYPLPIGPHSFYWFSLEAVADDAPSVGDAFHPPRLVTESPRSILRGQSRATLQSALPSFLRSRRWFGGKARPIRAATIVESVPLPNGDEGALHFVRVEYADGETDTYLLPLAFVTGERAEHMRRDIPDAIVAEVDLTRGVEIRAGLLVDGLSDPAFARGILGLFDRRRALKGEHGQAQARVLSPYAELRGQDAAALEPRVLRGEQSNTSLVFGERLIMKVLRRVDDGPSPEAEVGRFLTEHGFPNTPPLGATLQYRVGRSEPATLAVVHGLIPHATDAWTYTIDQLRRFSDRVLTRRKRPPAMEGRALLDLLDQATPPEVAEPMGAYLDAARLLGRRTAELHNVLVSPTDDAAFAVEPYTKLYQRSMYQSMRNLVGKNFRLLRRMLGSLSSDAKQSAQAVLDLESSILERFEVFLNRRITVVRSRCHGDYHLGQVLFTGKDFFIFDFEGEPARALAERRRKRSALRDVAGMIRSFQYAALVTLRDLHAHGPIDSRQRDRLIPWFAAWQAWVSSAFLREYLEAAGTAAFVPRERGQFRVLLEAFLLEKAIYEVGYELNNRPDWVGIPLDGIRTILGGPEGEDE